MKNIFNSVQVAKPKSNKFDLTHDVKMSGKMGNLMPTLALECVPGDKINLGCESLIRFAPLIAPVMHRMDVTMHYFFVPNRILWDGWEKFIVGAPDAEPFPTLQIDSTLSGDQSRFLDYLGVPPFPLTGSSVDISAFPMAAYQAIYNEYYRDQNLIPAVDYKLTSGNNPHDPFTVMRQRAWEHDYFTASLPFAQKGTAVDIPLGNLDGQVGFVEASNNSGSWGPVSQWTTSGGNTVGVPNAVTGYPDGDLITNLDGVNINPTTINDLRRAFKLQEWLEKNARGGTRYIENILMHFGVKSSDKRLQRPEYITGSKTPVIISEVLNTTGQTSGLPQGNMAGHAVSVNTGKQGSYYCEEHGYIIGIMSIMPKTCYQQGIPRTYLKKEHLDYFWPSFAHIGEQEVQNQELYAYTNTAEDTFGYVPRYAEYKYMPSRVAGDFRTTLDYWHLGRIFASQPNLNDDFVTCVPQNTDRIFAVQDGTDNLYCHVLHNIKAIRPMPIFGTPTI